MNGRFGSNRIAIMKKKTKKRLLYLIVLPISLFILFITFMTVFEYTAVAEIREAFVVDNKQETQSYGKTLFETRGCASCHAIKPKVKSLGPNLFGIATRKPEDYIRASIVTPGEVIVEGYEDVVMPNFGEILDKRQVEALVKYVSSIK